jgi:LysM repeat protein
MFERESKDSMNTSRLTGLSKAILLTVALVLAIVFVSGNASASSNSAATEFEYITVSTGETLWSLADEHANDESPRDWIAKVVELNNLVETEIQAGQRLALPN